MEEGQKRNGRVLTKFEMDDIEFAAISQVADMFFWHDSNPSSGEGSHNFNLNHEVKALFAKPC
jgi:hypothetical protein